MYEEFNKETIMLNYDENVCDYNAGNEKIYEVIGRNSSKFLKTTIILGM